MDGSTWVIVSHLGSFCYWGQFQHLYTLACNWVEIGANMSERCRNLMIIKVITRLACLIRRVLFPTLILWWIIRPGHCLGTDPQPCVYILLSKNPSQCQKEMSKLPPYVALLMWLVNHLALEYLKQVLIRWAAGENWSFIAACKEIKLRRWKQSKKEGFCGSATKWER